MTSPATHRETVDFLQHHNRFGLPAEDLKIFCQGTMPAVDADSGRLLLSAPGRLALGPDGHGGTLAALRNSGSLDAMRRRGIEQLFYMQVDNPLVNVCDAAFVGYHLLSGSEASTQVVAKREPQERVGVVVEIDGRVRIIEYSDLPGAAAARRSGDGALELWAGNIAVHVFDVAFFERMSQGGWELPFHRAPKNVSYVDADGHFVEPENPNAVKFERFIFDLLSEARSAIVVEVDAATHFAPLKNAPGAPRESPEWVRSQMLALYTDWLQQAGAQVDNGVAVEISPLFAVDGEQVAQKIEPGQRFTTPTYLR
jgi:UDP-N-acetylglucosamine/UDP-N-acetylgalactosamine diphosphorylase